MEKQILLTINVMASNRLETTEKCLKSLENLRKEIPCELIVTDTGCDAKMRSMVEAYADQIIDFSWCNDFAKARQVSVDAAHGEWYMYLDDDEWFIDTKEIENFFKSDQHQAMGFATYIQRNYSDFEGENYNDSWVGRMIKLTPEVHFEDKIHEHLEPIDGLNIIAIPAVVEHYGYIAKSEEDERAHYERNKTLLLEMLEENPMHFRARAHLAQEYRAAKEFAALGELCDESIALLGKKEGAASEQELSGFVVGTAITKVGLGLYEELLTICDTTKTNKNVSDMAKAYLLLLEANAYIDYRKHYKNAEVCCLEYLKLYAEFEKDEAKALVESTSVFVGQTFEMGNVERCYSMLLLCAIKCEEYAKIPELITKLGWEKKNAYVYPGLLYELVCAIATEESVDWRTTADTISRNETRWYYTLKFALEFAEDSEEKALRIFEVMSHLDRCDEFLRGLQTATQELAFAFASESESELMQGLRNAVMAYEGFASPIKYYLEQRELKKRAKLRAKQDEMQSLKQQIMSQAVELLSKGQKDTALQIMEQLKTMMPNDLEITTLALQIRLHD